MTNEDYLEAQCRIGLQAGMVRALPLKEFIERAERANTIGPIVDPTLWTKGHDNLDKILDVAKALRFCQVRLEELFEASKQ